MSADKHKKRDRAFAFLLARRAWIKHDEPQRFYFTGPMSANMRWLVEKGFATVYRMAKGGSRGGGRNVFEEEPSDLGRGG